MASDTTYILTLTKLLVPILLSFIGVAGIIWAGLAGLGSCGFFKVLRHEEVDMKQKVRTWKDIEVSDKRKNGDFTGPRLENPIKLPFTETLFKSMINDQRDLPLLHVLISATLVLYPLAFLVFLLFVYGDFQVACFFGFGVYQFVRIKFFMHSMLHYRHFSSHRPLFKIKWLNVLSNIYLDPIMGIPPLVFLLHHPIMHHVANNGFYDISSTEPYARDNWLSFANYWFRFQILAYAELPMFAWRTGRYNWFLSTILVIGTFFYLMAHLTLAYSGWATLCVFGLPWCYDHADDGMRNWCQHLFVVQYNSKAPAETFWDYNCGLAYVLVDSLENRLQFNEGYHVVHHAFGGKHWSDMPKVFYKQVEKMALCENDLMCITWTNSAIWEIWLHVASDKLPQLVKNKYVHIPTAARPHPPTVEEVVIELKNRLKPLDFRKRKSTESQTGKRKQWRRQPSVPDLIPADDHASDPAAQEGCPTTKVTLIKLERVSSGLRGVF